MAAPGGMNWVFNPPPGWPAPSADWQPPVGWQPDPSWPAPPAGWEFWQPAPPAGQDGGISSVRAGELHLGVGGQSYVFRPGRAVTIGRGADNEVVVSYPAVSRQHARLLWGHGGWVFENVGQAPSFLHGQVVTRVAVGRPLELTLGSADGPVLRIETSSPGQRGAHRSRGPLRQRDADLSRPRMPSNDDLSQALHILFPVRSWASNSAWRQGLRLLVITYALLPLVFLAMFASSADLATPGWAYSLYVAPLWAIGFWLLIRPGHIGSLEVKVGIGIIIWTVTWMNIVTITINNQLHQPLSFLAALAVGFNEETTKALPIVLAGLFLLKYRTVKLDVRMWMFLGTIAGLAFGVSEQALYTSRYIIDISQAQINSQAVGAVLQFAERVFVDGFQHAVWAGIAAFFIGIAVNYPRRRVLILLLAVTVPAVLHALNDWSLGAFNSLWPSVVIQAVSLFLFLGYTMSAAAIERQVSQTPLFRGDSLIMEAVAEPGRARPL